MVAVSAPVKAPERAEDQGLRNQCSFVGLTEPPLLPLASSYKAMGVVGVVGVHYIGLWHHLKVVVVTLHVAN